MVTTTYRETDVPITFQSSRILRFIAVRPRWVSLWSSVILMAGAAQIWPVTFR